MATKKEQETLQNVVFRMTPSEIERLDLMAEKYGVTRSQFLRNLIMVGLEESEMFNKFGLVRAAITVRDICGWMSSQVSRTLAKDIEEK